MATVSTFVFTSNTETVTRTKLNNLVANLLSEFNGSISNINVDVNAEIIGTKIDLSEVGAIGGTTSAAGTFTTLTTTGNTAIGNGADTLTINCSSGITYTPAATWTFTADQTVSGTWANLGSVTTIDVNGGTLDGVNIGGVTATGELFVNDSSDDAAGLGSQGTSGQRLTSAGSGANPTWETPTVAAVTLLSTTTGTDTNTGNITLSASAQYMVTIDITMGATDDGVDLRFNSDGTGDDYGWAIRRHDFGANFDSVTSDSADTAIQLSGTDIIEASQFFRAKMYIDTYAVSTNVNATVIWDLVYFDNDVLQTVMNIRGGGIYKGGAITDFELFAGNSFTYAIRVYQLAQS
jgi:hypothetical protein